MYTSVQKLVPEQRLVFDQVIGFCKNLRKATFSKRWQKPKPPLLKVHGGAGAGKSKLINDIAQWVEYFLRTDNNRNPNQPVILKVAPTGKAASLIQGMTLHHAFHFKFSNEYTSLPDSLRESMRNDLSQLQVLIIDEMSMVKSDLLYQVHKRLQEVKQNDDDFGGVSVLLFGDLMQLQPVRANWIFEAPKDPKFSRSYALRSLWSLFVPVELKENHRQGNDAQYAQLLNRVRFGKPTEQDIATLKMRLCIQPQPNSLYVFGTRKPVTELNLKRLNELPGPVEIVEARTIHPSQKQFKPQISPDGFISETPFLSKLCIKINARVMLTFNSDTADGLTNGATGTVSGVLKNSRGLITTIFVKFDDLDIGNQAKTKMTKEMCQVYPDSTPLTIHKFDYSLGKLAKGHTAKATVYQFPLTLAWALTAHKCQGQTVKKPNQLAADLKSVFTSGQAYVILGRVQDINQLCLLTYSDNCIRVNAKAKEEAERISLHAIKSMCNIWTSPPPQSLRITSLNIRSLVLHYPDLRNDTVLLMADIICLNETYIKPGESAERFQLKDYKGYFANQGMAAGVAVFVKHQFASASFDSYTCETFQIVLVSSRYFDIFAIYRSPKTNQSFKSLFDKIQHKLHPTKTTFLCGDFNLPKTPNQFEAALKDYNIFPCIKIPTHINGNILDQFYSNNQNCEVASIHLHPVYYSDHDAICVVARRT